MVKKINEKRKEKPGKVAKYEGKTKEQIIAAEKRKLGGIYKKLDENTKKATENLVEEAAFMGASLHELRQKIAEKRLHRRIPEWCEPERRQEVCRS